LPPDVLAGVREVTAQRVPLKRFGTAQEVAEVAALLASPAARYIAGTTIDVDGGMAHAV
jgi:3-oxoacyl-[acyl-carrier protein] reductase